MSDTFNGIVLLDKPLGLTSNQALTRVKRAFGVDKAGHTGALDPLATGMLPCCLGEATKVAGYLLGARKAYRATARLGAITSSDDAEGEVIATATVPEIDQARLRDLMAGFVGRIQQRPPAYSALKRGGVPLYKLARRGVAVEVPPREVEIVSIDLESMNLPEFTFHVVCGSGTYIRSLARDMGAALGCGGHLAGLRRLWVDPFHGVTMVTLEDIETAREAGPAALAALIQPMDRGLTALPAVHLDANDSRRLRQGQIVTRPNDDWLGLCRVYGVEGALLALGERREDGSLRPRRVLLGGP